MNPTILPGRVDVYRRRRDVPGEEFRRLLTEVSSEEQDAFSRATQLVETLRAEFPTYEFTLKVVEADH